tara:strand:- start:3363 stop:3686 length:324 start_codon:yes stop_codon:yes gene_type:complete
LYKILPHFNPEVIYAQQGGGLHGWDVRCRSTAWSMEVPPRCRVSLINYKGGSGRILEGKLNKNNGNYHQKNIFSPKFASVRKIKKWMWRKIQKLKNQNADQNPKKCF